MISIEAILGASTVICGVASALFGGGLFRQALRHSADSAVQKFRLEQTDLKVRENDVAIQGLKQDVALINKDVKSFEQHIRKLDMLPEISSKLSGIEATMNYMKEQISRLDQAHHNG